MLQNQLPANESGTLMHLVQDATIVSDDDADEETKFCKNLFKNLNFFLRHEVPRKSLLFIIPAFGGVVSWEGDGSPFAETDEGIIHQIVDRPTQGHISLSREYVQPQWVFDCVNSRILLPTEAYMVGRVPPPHISPFVNNEAEGYLPDYAETIKRLRNAAKCQVLPMPGLGDGDLDDPQNLLKGVVDRREANEAAEKKCKLKELEKQYHDELNLELQGIPYSVSLSDKNLPASNENAGFMEDDEELEQIAEDAKNLSKLSMSRRNSSKLYDAMQIGIKWKRNRNKVLEDRKKVLDREVMVLI